MARSVVAFSFSRFAHLALRRRADRPGSPYPVQLGASAQTVSLQAEHVRLCINSYALQTQSPEAGAALRKALDAAITIISAHNLSSQGDLSLSFAIDVSRLCCCFSQICLTTPVPHHHRRTSRPLLDPPNQGYSPRASKPVRPGQHDALHRGRHLAP